VTESEFILLVSASAAVLVGIVRRIAVMHGVMDLPTHRSSHDAPTPRGGGLGLIAVVIVAFAVLDRSTPSLTILASIAACAAVAAVGWFDDRRGLTVRTRFMVHVLSGVAVGSVSLQPDAPLALRIALLLWWAFWTVSSINLVNFMDGINGFVASQVAIFATSLMLFGWQYANASWHAAAVAGACIGFLPWNFPRARIFLGDVGSGALGLLVPLLALLAMRESGVGLIQAHLPLVPLFGDATFTILRRWHRGEKLTEAHRSHLYQRLANGGMGHTRVTLIYAASSLIGATVAHRVIPGPIWFPIALYGGFLVFTHMLLERRLHRGANQMQQLR
jgi:UDP-N-acetylmuramyl pentapeptide phosphotransferase/UDP-N-acetylglucosamine-1-phosphate transferase